MTFYDKKRLWMESVLIIFFLLMTGIALYAYPLLPDRIIIHWNAAGEPDNFSSKNSVFLLPGLYLAVAILLTILPAIDSLSENVKRFYREYYAFKIVLGVFFVALFIVTLLPNFGYYVDIARTVVVMVSLLFISIGILFRNSKRNYFLGIRTPWTLSNDFVWEETHRIGKYAFVIYGIAMIILSFLFRPQLLFLVFIGGIAIVVIFLFAYSYLLYKKVYKNKR